MIDYKWGVQLGPLSDINSATLRGWRNKPEIYKWCRQYEPLEKWNHERWWESLGAREDVKMYGIFKDREPIGVAGLTSIDWVNSRAEFSLYIDPEKQGSGLGKGALKTLCAHGFSSLNLNCIWGESFFGNNATKIFQSIGFQLEGVRREFYYREGEYLDAYMFSLLKKEFMSGCFERDTWPDKPSVLGEITNEGCPVARIPIGKNPPPRDDKWPS